MEERESKQKTRQQEKAYHLLYKQIANYCMENGITMQMVLQHLERYRVDVDEKFVKSTWKAILETKTGKKSTTEQTTDDVKAVQEEFGRLWGEITGQTFDWPSIEAFMLNNYDV